MKGLYILLLLLCSYLCNAQQYIVRDSFNTANQYIDISKTLLWGTNTQPTSAFTLQNITDSDGLSFNAICLNDSAIKYVNYHTLANSTKASTCFDYAFPTPIGRNINDTLSIEFDVLWQSLSNSGEVGRINVMLLHNYPQGGPPFGKIDSIHTQHPFGRPSYHFRIRNSESNGLARKGFMGMGGNNDPLGKLYIHVSGNDSLHWLPGAVPSTGTGTFTYPTSSLTSDFSSTVASARHWVHCTMLVTYERVELYRRLSKESGIGNLIISLNTPVQKPANYYTLYHWFNQFEALRFYAYSASQTANTYFSNIQVKTNAKTLHTSQAMVPANLQIYPNPVHCTLHVRSTQPIDRIRIYNALGVQVYHNKLATESAEIQTETFKPGMYILVTQSNQNLHRQTFIKQ